MSQDPATPPAPPQRPVRGESTVLQFVGFCLGDEEYAIPITKIQEIILMKPITRLPQVPEHVEGLINLRGSVIPVVNLRKRFGLPARGFDEETRTIVVNLDGRTVGCIVDAVTQVLRIHRDQIQPSPLATAGGPCRFVSGLARLDDRLLILLEVELLLRDEGPALAPAAAAAGPSA